MKAERVCTNEAIGAGYFLRVLKTDAVKTVALLALRDILVFRNLRSAQPKPPRRECIRPFTARRTKTRWNSQTAARNPASVCLPWSYSVQCGVES
jgi:hypothetical protein